MTRPTARVLTLLELLQSGGVRTLADLSDRLGVDSRTVRRYVQHLIDLDIPVESVRGRYGGYRLARGHRLPPLMLDEDEALAVLLGLTGRSSTAGETAAAKLRRVLPARLTQRLDAVLDGVAFTAPGVATPDGAILLPLAAAVRDRQPVRLGERLFHPYGLVVHRRRWYVIGLDPQLGEERTFRLDRIARVRGEPGAFEPPAGFDAAGRLLTAFATADYRYEIRLRVRATASRIRSRLPPSIAVVHEDDAGPWLRVDMRAESLDWVPAVLAALDRPFVIEHPEELRESVAAMAARLAGYAARPGP